MECATIRGSRTTSDEAVVLVAAFSVPQASQQEFIDELHVLAEAGDAEAQYHLGSILVGLEESTELVEVDTEAGVEWLKKSVASARF